jgi:hypothetical protein
MVFGVEKKKLEKLYSRLLELSTFSDESSIELHDIYKYYVLVIKKLHSKEANIFANIHKYGIAQMKKHKEQIKKDPDQESFDAFREYIRESMEDALDYMKDYLHV